MQNVSKISRSKTTDDGEFSKLLFELQKDHEAILKKTNLLRAVIEPTDGVNDGDSKASVTCNRLEHLFGQHYAREERLLYPLLGTFFGQDVCETLSLEHNEIRNLVQRVAGLIDNHANRAEASQEATESISKLIQRMRAHFSKEENVLFWYLNLQLSGRARNYHEDSCHVPGS